MKQFISVMCLMLLLSGMVLMVITKMLSPDVMEITLAGYHDTENLKRRTEQTGIYDYLILNGIYTYEGNMYTYEGDIQLLLYGKSGCRMSMEDGKEVLLGKRYVENNYLYDPLGEKYFSEYGEMNVGGIVPGDGIYLSSTDEVDVDSVRVQRLYAVLRDEENNAIDRDTVISILQSYGISILSAVYYKDIFNFMYKIIISLGLLLMTYLMVKAVSAAKGCCIYLRKGYKLEKYDSYVIKFLARVENRRMVLKFAIFLIYMIACIICVLYLSVKFLNMRMPFKVNPVSPRSIWEALSSFGDLMNIYLTYGFTDAATAMLIIASAIALCATGMILYGAVRQANRNHNKKGTVK